MLVVVGLLAGASTTPGCYTSSGGEDGDAGDVADVRPDDGGTDVPRPPYATRFVLRLVSDVPETLYVTAWEASSRSGHWLTLLDGGAEFRKAESCGICDCDECPVCPMCGAPCMELAELTSGIGEVEYLWDGRRWESDGACGTMPCEDSANVPAGSYTARFCWGDGRGGTAPCDEFLLGETCADVTFTLPDPDGVVEYVIRHTS